MGARLRWTDAGGLAVRMPTDSPDAAAVADALEGKGPALCHVLDLAADTIRPPAGHQLAPASSSSAAGPARAAAAANHRSGADDARAA
ncbi:MAG: hypothetical protein IPJ58_12205 [Ardenticatenia bacterium]|nr:hypothetical protein [Ardenticatenia bacterium]